MAQSLQGIPFQIEYLHKSEDDSRRHKSRCIYIGPNGNCACESRPCYSSSTCLEYSENVERLRGKYPALYEYKKALEKKRLDKKSADVIFEILLTLPLRRKYIFKVETILAEIQRKWFDEFTAYVTSDKIKAACEKFNTTVYSELDILPLPDSSSFRCYKRNFNPECERCPYCNMTVKKTKLSHHIQYNCAYNPNALKSQSSYEIKAPLEF